MTLAIRKLVLLALVALIFLIANALVIALWLKDAGVIDTAVFIRKEFLTGTAITVIVALLILLVAPGQGIANISRRCSVCGRGRCRGSYCGDCGSKL